MLVTDALRERYGDALLALLTREGPLADLAPVLERLDVLTGVDLAQKQLAPVIEHGPDQEDASRTLTRETSQRSSGYEAGVEQEASPGRTVSSSVDAGSSPSASVRIETAAEDPVHEATRQAPVSASDGSVEPTEATPAAPSPETPTRRYGKRDHTKVNLLCSCGCGTTITREQWEIDVEPGRKFYLNPAHYGNTTRKNPPANGERARNAGASSNGKTPALGVEDAGSTPAAPASTDEPARGLAAITANPPVAQPSPSKFVCTCPDWWREKTVGWREDLPNEGHHDNCALYRKGGHRWPLPSATGVEKGPFSVQCGWCAEKRDVDAHGVPWAVSELNPANGGKVPA